MMQDMELSIERLSELKALGVQLAIDDFGTGLLVASTTSGGSPSTS